MNLIQILLIILAISLGLTFLLWLASLAKRDSSIVDPYWGFGFVLLSWATASICGDWGPRVFFLLFLVTVWGLRLSGYLFLRNLGHEEDRRYQAMRDKHGEQFWWVSLFTVFLLQGTIMWLVAMPLLVGIYLSETAPTLGWIDFLAVGIWGLGLFFESVGDYQMAKFKSNPESQGKVMDRGLWKYTRHPNYFGDFCVWWGHYLAVVTTGAWWTFISPTIMSFFLIKVSGVAMLEKDIGERRPGYAEYIKRTNAFFPGPPK